MLPKRRFYFLRHGQTDWNVEGRYQGHSDIPLNATGIAQATAAAQTLAAAPIDLIVTSPLIRAVKTAAIAAERLDRPISVERRLIERNFGSFDGLVIREVKAQHGLRPDQSSLKILPPDADPGDEIYERVPATIAKWLGDFPNGTLLFVAHGGVFDALHAHLLGKHRTGAESGHAVPYVAEPTSTGWSFGPVQAAHS